MHLYAGPQSLVDLRCIHPAAVFCVLYDRQICLLVLLQWSDTNTVISNTVQRPFVLRFHNCITDIISTDISTHKKRLVVGVGSWLASRKAHVYRNARCACLVVTEIASICRVLFSRGRRLACRTAGTPWLTFFFTDGHFYSTIAYCLCLSSCCHIKDIAR